MTTTLINPIKCYIKNTFLYNMDETKTGYTDVEIIGVCAYEAQTLTFHILVDKQFLYSDVPIIALYWKQPESDSELFELNDLVYHENKTFEVDCFILSSLVYKKISIYMVKKNKWISGNYLLSIDFWKGNDLLHLCKLDNGQFSLSPNHKINFNNSNTLTDFKKSRQTWKL